MTKPKGDHTLTAVRETSTHPLGWELRLMIGRHGMHMTWVVRSSGEMDAAVGTWRAALLEKG